MNEPVKHSMVWASCIAAIAACFMLSSIFGQPATPYRTALQECAWDRKANGSAFCVELAKSATRDSQ